MIETKFGSTLVRAVLIFIVAALPTIGACAGASEPPKLVLQITVDALRGDLPGRFENVLGDGGFRYLMENGVHYTNAHYQHANTETIVGHVSLATGTVPAAHGMVANVWFDRELDRLAYKIDSKEAATTAVPILFLIFISCVSFNLPLGSQHVGTGTTPYFQV